MDKAYQNDHLHQNQMTNVDIPVYFGVYDDNGFWMGQLRIHGFPVWLMCSFLGPVEEYIENTI